jgi:hypothetical protein
MTNLADILKSAGQDPATVSISIKTIYGTVNYCRTAVINGSVGCDGGVITVKSEAATLGVPMTLVPQLSVGQPTLTQPPPPAVAPPAPRRPPVVVPRDSSQPDEVVPMSLDAPPAPRPPSVPIITPDAWGSSRLRHILRAWID